MTDEFNLSLKGLEFVGKHMTQTKLKYTWIVRIKNQEHTIILYHSRLTNKYLLKIDGAVVAEKKGMCFEKAEFGFQILSLKLRIVACTEDRKFKLVNTGEHIVAPMYPKVDWTKNSIDSHGSLKQNGNQKQINTNIAIPILLANKYTPQKEPACKKQYSPPGCFKDKGGLASNTKKIIPNILEDSNVFFNSNKIYLNND